MLRFFFLFLLFFQTISVFSSPRATGSFFGSKWKVGLSFGTSTYMSEYNMYRSARWNAVSVHYSEPNFAAGISMNREFSPIVSGELQYGYSQVGGRGDKKINQLEGYYFKTIVNELVLFSVFAIDNCFSTPSKERAWHVFLKVGIGTSSMSEKVGEIDIDPSNLVFTIPGAVGVSVRISSHLHGTIDCNYRLLDSDELNGRFENLTKGENNTSVVWGAYQNYKIGLSYQLGRNNKRRKKRYVWYERP